MSGSASNVSEEQFSSTGQVDMTHQLAVQCSLVNVMLVEIGVFRYIKIYLVTLDEVTV